MLGCSLLPRKVFLSHFYPLEIFISPQAIRSLDSNSFTLTLCDIQGHPILGDNLVSCKCPQRNSATEQSLTLEFCINDVTKFEFSSFYVLHIVIKSHEVPPLLTHPFQLATTREKRQRGDHITPVTQEIKHLSLKKSRLCRDRRILLYPYYYLHHSTPHSAFTFDGLVDHLFSKSQSGCNYLKGLSSRLTHFESKVLLTILSEVSIFESEMVSEQRLTTDFMSTYHYLVTLQDDEAFFEILQLCTSFLGFNSKIPTENVTLMVHSSRGLRPITVPISMPVEYIKYELERLYEFPSLENYDLVMANSGDATTEKLDPLRIIEEYRKVFTHNMYLVPSSVRVKIQTFFQCQEQSVTVTLNSITVDYLKNLIYSTWGIPSLFQRLIAGGQILSDNTALLEIIANQSQLIAIDVLVDQNYQRSFVPVQYRDPIVGLPYHSPVRAKGKFSYPFRTENKNDSSRCSSLHQPSPPETLSNDILTINNLGSVFAVLEPVKEILQDPFSPNKEPKVFSASYEDVNRSPYGLPFVPQILVLGQEKCGKSSLLQRLLMYPIFPVSPTLQTSSPLVLKYRRGPISEPQMRLCSRNSDQVLAVYDENQCDIRSTIRCKASTALSGDETKLVIQITHPMAPNIDIIDMPGLVSVGNDEDIVQKIVKDYINEHTIVLVPILSRTTDCCMSPLVDFLHHSLSSPKESSIPIIGVMSQMDRVDFSHGNQLKRMMREKSSPFPNGFVLTTVLPNPSYDSDDEDIHRYESLERSALGEIKFFNERFRDANEVGCNALIKKLETAYLNLLSDYVTDIVNKLEKRRQSLIQEDMELGLPSAHFFDHCECHESVKQNFLTMTVSLLDQKWQEIEMAFTAEYLGLWRTKLSSILALNDTKFQRQFDCEQLSSFLSQMFHCELQFWREQFRIIFSNESSSAFKLARFPTEIELAIGYIIQVIEERQETLRPALETCLEEFYRCHDLSPQAAECLFQKLKSVLLSTFLHLRSFNLTPGLSQRLANSSFIEISRKDRFAIRQQLQIIDTTLTDLELLRTKSHSSS